MILYCLISEPLIKNQLSNRLSIYIVYHTALSRRRKRVHHILICTEYETCLEDEVEAAARADEARRVERRDGLLAGLRGLRAARAGLQAQRDAQAAALSDYAEAAKQLDMEIERAT